MVFYDINGNEVPEEKLSWFYTNNLLEPLSSQRYFKRINSSHQESSGTEYYDKFGNEVPLEKLAYFYTTELLEPNSSARYSKTR